MDVLKRRSLRVGGARDIIFLSDHPVINYFNQITSYLRSPAQQEEGRGFLCTFGRVDLEEIELDRR